MDTKKLRQKILDLAIHGKLVPQDPNDEPASVLLERIRAEKEQLIKEGKIKAPKKSNAAGDTSHYPKEMPFEVPEGWVWTTIGDILINRDGERIPVSSAIRKKQNAKLYDYYGAAGVIDKVDDYLFNERLLLIGEDGANLLSRSKDNAFFAEGKYWVNNHAHIIDASDKRLLDYIALYINAIPLDMYVTGSAQPKLNQDNLNRISVPLPPLAEQFRIVQAVEECKRIVNGIENNQIELQETIDHTKQKILSLAIAGKLVPQDPTDDSAYELLKRINPAFQASHNLHYEGELPNGWALCRLDDILDYEQPQAYIVSSTEYSNTYKTPVLTPGKSFVLGYTNEMNGVCNHLPVIIFDDFTTESKYVDFPFKVKSSAMKILRARGDMNLKYVALFMSIVRLTGDTHKRYWISEYSKIPIPVPPLRDQERIVSLVNQIFNQLDHLITNVSDD